MSAVSTRLPDPTAPRYPWPPARSTPCGPARMTRSILIGLGNPLLSDDGVGLWVARHVHRLLDIPDLDLCELAVGGVELMETLLGYSMGVIIDAIITPNGKPGDLYLLDLQHCPATRHTCMSHEIDLLEGLELARRLQLPVPDCLRLYAVEVLDPFTFGDRMNEQVKRSIPRIARKVAAELRPLFRG
jgi:hydrogenase maturation protease